MTTPTNPANPANPANPPNPPPKGRRAVLLLTVAGAAITGLAAVQAWAAGTADDPVLGRRLVSVAGTAAAPALLLLVAVAVAGMLASLIGGRVLRVASGVAIALAGGGVAAFAARSGADPAAALASPAAAGTGRTGVSLEAVAATGWPWVAMAGGGLLLLAGLLVVRGGSAWGSGARRFERAPVLPGAVRGDASDAALGDASGAALGEASDAAPDGPAEPARGPDRQRAADDWERLSRDEDPTA